MIETFNDLDQAILFIESLAFDAAGTDYFKAELLMLIDGRWRVGIETEPQLDLFDGFLE